MKPAEFAPFELRGGYHLFRIIGKGEFGRVYLATDRNKFEVAVKEVRYHFTSRSAKRICVPAANDRNSLRLSEPSLPRYVTRTW